jgi:hypothetical protein
MRERVGVFVAQKGFLLFITGVYFIKGLRANSASLFPKGFYYRSFSISLSGYIL